MAFSQSTVIFFFLCDKSLQSEDLLPSRGVAASGFPPLRNIPHCCLPQESGPCLSPNVADQPLSSAIDRRLGGPLPRQPANRTRSHLTPIESFHTISCETVCLCGISSRFQLLSPILGQVAHVLLTRSPLSYPNVHPKTSVKITPFDLHVLGTPPAFVLSQDQTLD